MNLNDKSHKDQKYLNRKRQLLPTKFILAHKIYWSPK